MRQHFVVSSIGSRDVAGADWPNIRRFEHFLQLLNLVNDAFNVHAVSISNISMAIVKRGGMWRWPPRTAHRNICVLMQVYSNMPAVKSQELVIFAQPGN
ncbi:MAG TPA: hypothetical protein VIH78_16470 [Terriglobales bacterium]